MSLMESCTNLESTLLQLEVARRGAQDGDAIDQRIRQWDDRKSDLLSALQRAGWLHLDLSQVTSYSEQFGYTQQLALQAAQRLEERPDVECLTEEDLWVRLLQTAQKAAGAAWEQVKTTWRFKVMDFQQLIPPHQLRATASPLPQNDVVLGGYEIQYRTASRMAGMEAPKTASDLEAFTQAIDACRSLASQLRFDAPKEVEEFFRAINAGGASLSLVTPTVLAWLSESDQLSRYTVRGIAR